MALVFDATIGGASATSLVSELQFLAFLSSRTDAPEGFNPDATELSDAQKIALIEGTREVQRIKDWEGLQINDVQALAFPRKWIRNPNSPTWQYYSESTIPDPIVQGICEYALEVLSAGTTDFSSAARDALVTEETLGPITTRWEPNASRFAPSLAQRATGIGRFPRVVEWFAPLRNALSTNQFRMVRG